MVVQIAIEDGRNLVADQDQVVKVGQVSRVLLPFGVFEGVEGGSANGVFPVDAFVLCDLFITAFCKEFGGDYVVGEVGHVILAEFVEETAEEGQEVVVLFVEGFERGFIEVEFLIFLFWEFDRFN